MHLVIILKPKKMILSTLIFLTLNFAFIFSGQSSDFQDETISFLESQSTVITAEKEFALFYWIYINQKLSSKALQKSLKIVTNLQKYVDAISPDKDLVAGVGFGEDFYSMICKKQPKTFSYVTRKGELGNLPATGGDIFIHAKSNSHSKLFELAERLSVLLKSFIETASDVYGFQYKINRDLTDFVDGTENPKETEIRRKVAVIPETGGSFLLTQRWVHDLGKKISIEACTREEFIGRTLEQSEELKNKTASSHVARMTGGTDFKQATQFEIVRQSMPYGVVHGEAGLFFVAYAASVANFDFMLDRMVGADDNIPDDIMRLTRCVSGNYWYFPGVEELKLLSSSKCPFSSY